MIANTQIGYGGTSTDQPRYLLSIQIAEFIWLMQVSLCLCAYLDIPAVYTFILLYLTSI